MKEDKPVLERINHRDGMTVPDGFFAEFSARMAESLPVTPFEEGDKNVQIPRTFWQRVRPYVYMAAMFAGVWCMLKMFTLLTSPVEGIGDSSPVLARALDNDAFVNDYVIDNISQWDIIDEMMEDGFDVHTLSLPVEELNIDQTSTL